jgi:hypothetical protein
VTVDKDLNALSVTTTAAVQQRITGAIAQLDVSPNQSGYNPMAPGGLTPVATSGSSFEVIAPHSAIPVARARRYGGADFSSYPSFWLTSKFEFN